MVFNEFQISNRNSGIARRSHTHQIVKGDFKREIKLLLFVILLVSYLVVTSFK